MRVNRVAACIGVIALGIVMIIAGIANDDAYGVLQKSIRICLECVGIG